jgi:hypothetical protein
LTGVSNFNIPKSWETACSYLTNKLNILEGKVNQPKFTVVKKDKTETRISTSSFATDAKLFFAAEASSNYAFRCMVFFDTAAAADFKFQLIGPSGATTRYMWEALPPGAAAYSNIGGNTAFSSSQSVLGAGTSGGYVQINGVVYSGTTAGEVALQWAQDTLTASNTSVLKGSYLEWLKL